MHALSKDKMKFCIVRVVETMHASSLLVCFNSAKSECSIRVGNQRHPRVLIYKYTETTHYIHKYLFNWYIYNKK